MKDGEGYLGGEIKGHRVGGRQRILSSFGRQVSVSAINGAVTARSMIQTRIAIEGRFAMKHSTPEAAKAIAPNSLRYCRERRLSSADPKTWRQCDCIASANQAKPSRAESIAASCMIRASQLELGRRAAMGSSGSGDAQVRSAPPWFDVMAPVC